VEGIIGQCLGDTLSGRISAGRAAIAVTIELSEPETPEHVEGGRRRLAKQRKHFVQCRAGQRSIEYKDIPGWIRPSQEAPTLQPANHITDKNYTLQSGSLQVTIQPNNIAQAGAQWRVGGGPGRRAVRRYQFACGKQTIEFKDVSGWIKPAASNINITVGQTVQTGGTYGNSYADTVLSTEIRGVADFIHNKLSRFLRKIVICGVHLMFEIKIEALRASCGNVLATES